MLLTNLTSQDYYFGPLHLAAGNGSQLTVDDTSATSLYLTDDSVADAINTLYASAKVQVTGAADPFPRATGQPEILHGDGSPEGLVYGGQGSLYLRRNSSQVYQKTTGIHLNTGWVGLAVGGAVSSSLYAAGPPSNPSDGDIWRGLAVDTGNLGTTSGVIWEFRYNAQSGSSYKWEFIGGIPLNATYDTDANLAMTTGVWRADDTNGPNITLSRSGDYDVDFSAFMGLCDAGVWGSIELGIGINNNYTSPVARSGGPVVAVGQLRAHTGRKKRITGVNASYPVKMLYYAGGSGNPTAPFAYRDMFITPVRIS